MPDLMWSRLQGEPVETYEARPRGSGRVRLKAECRLLVSANGRGAWIWQMQLRRGGLWFHAQSGPEPVAELERAQDAAEGAMRIARLE